MAPPDDSLLSVLAELPLAAGEPQMSADLAFRIVSRALHLASAIILGGGVFYMRSILAQSGAETCFAGRRQVWGRWVAVASTFLIATGMYNYLRNVWDGKLPGAAEVPFTYHILFGIKFLLALVVMFIAAIVAGKTATAEKARANIARWLNVAWTCILAIVVIGAMMRALH